MKVRTVYDYLDKRGATALLSEEDIEFATSEIIQDGTKTRSEIADVLSPHSKAIISKDFAWSWSAESSQGRRL